LALSTLTKVFVILLVVFSLTFTAMTVSIVAQVPDWKNLAEKYSENARVADTNLRSLIAANAAELATARDVARSQLRQIAELERAIKQAQTEAAGLKSDLARAASESSSAEAMNRGLLAQLQVAEAARNEYRKQRDELEKQDIDLQRRNIDLNDRVAEQTAQIVVLAEQQRQSEQQIHILREENERLAMQVSGASAGLSMEDPASVAMKGVTPLTPVVDRVIQGQVIDVAGNLVTVSVGAADGVREGMVFVLYRADAYVGDVKISLVDPNQAAGRLVRSTLGPQIGDRASDARGLTAARG
jgi:hypothetical protein